MLPACRNIKSQPSGGGRVTRLKSGVTRSSPDPHLLPDTALPHLAHHLLHGAHGPAGGGAGLRVAVTRPDKPLLKPDNLLGRLKAGRRLARGNATSLLLLLLGLLLLHQLLLPHLLHPLLL